INAQGCCKGEARLESALRPLKCLFLLAPTDLGIETRLKNEGGWPPSPEPNLVTPLITLLGEVSKVVSLSAVWFRLIDATGGVAVLQSWRRVKDDLITRPETANHPCHPGLSVVDGHVVCLRLAATEHEDRALTPALNHRAFGHPHHGGEGYMHQPHRVA